MNVFTYSENLSLAIAEHGDPICRTTDPDAWFPEMGEGNSKPMRYAKAMCAECPVMVQCRDYGIANNEQHGIWGGLDTIQRNKIRANKNRAMRNRRAREAARQSA
jgi:WhiB family redox-sensing transcriptional regulator